ncbi:flippase-like domain-containing protein [Pleurocapsales cyanobacterium LEGE 06147]|nr:flippase-like domain-containing protein [Pleurocapsales cyanobacterium LEGE 06147]
MKKTISFIGYFFVTVSLLFLASSLVTNFKSIPSFNFNYKAVIGLVVATFFCAGVTAIISVAWQILIRGGDIKIPFKQAYIIIGKSQIGKYLPGNIFHYAGRLILGRQYGIPTEAIILSTGVETLIIAITGLAVAVTGFLFSNIFGDNILFVLSSINLTRIIVVLLITVPVVLILGIAAYFLLPIQGWLKSRLNYFNIGRILVSVLLYTIIFIFFGLSIAFLINFFWAVKTPLHWYQFVWSFAMAWVIGFVTPGAPGGIGIRETILVGLYSQELGEGLAIALSLTLRVVTSLGDLLAFALAYYLERT